jgi:endonuclease/exonuclease/phosphatase family metal-dependent hydrolase
MSLATKLMVVLNLFFIGFLLCSYLSLYISPAKFWPIAFAGLAYPVFLVFNLFFVLFWLVFLKKYFLLSLITILLGYNQIKTYIKFSGSDRKLSFENSIKVMSYNVRLFDLYKWRNESSKMTQSEIFGLFQSESPDILCLQDYYSGTGIKINFADTICSKSGYKYRNIELINKENKGLPYGLAIFSKYPIVHTQKLDFPNSKVNFCQSIDVTIGKDTIRIINMHLESIKFGKEDYSFVNDVASAEAANEELKKGLRAISGKMKFAYIKRASQVETVVDFIKKSPYPVILAGDFNDTPVSYCYRQIDNELDDTFVDSGKGFGQTHAQMLPLLRIDYIFHSQALQTIEHTIINKDYSDHFPIVARFMLPQ